ARPALAGLVALAALTPTPPGQAQAVPDSIQADGVPPIPPDGRRPGALPARPPGRVPGLAHRRQALIRTQFADTDQIHRVAAPDGAGSRVTSLPGRVLIALPRPGRIAPRTGWPRGASDGPGGRNRWSRGGVTSD